MAARHNERINCGKLGRLHGLNGALSVFWYSGVCPLPEGGVLYLFSERDALIITKLKKQGNRDLICFHGINDRNDARGLVGCELFVLKKDLVDLDNDEYYVYQLVGLNVVTEEGIFLGKVKKVFTVGSTEVYEVTKEDTPLGKEILIPATKDIILSIDTEKKEIVVKPLKGMI